MRCFYNFILNGFSNTYIVGPDASGEAIIVDPGELNIKLFKLIEDNDFYIKHILITHDDSPHTEGIRSLLKIYDAKVYSNSGEIHDIKTVRVKAGMELNLSGFKVKVLGVPEPLTNSILFKIQNILFTGDSIGAGRLNKKLTSLERDKLKLYLEKHLLYMDNNTIILPGHGPPSTLKAERMFNPDITDILEYLPAEDEMNRH